MNDWLKAFNPSSPITTEAEATRAAKASAISIVIGVAVGLIGIGWTLANPQIMADAMAQATNGEVDAAQAAAAGQIAMYTAGFMVLVQIIFGVFQWKNPNKFIAILFIVLIAFGLVSTLATPLLAASMPNMPNTPVWQIALSVVVMIVQLVLHISGLRGIKKLDQIQLEQAR